MTETNRDWLTLAFGIGLVTVVVGLSVRQNVQWGGPAKPDANAATPAPAAAPAPSTSGTSAVQSAAVPAVNTEAAAATAPAGRSDAAAPAADVRRARFDVSVPVVHKHRFGSCEGTLRATTDNLVFGSSNKEDSFQLSFKDVDRFDIAAGTLSVRRRGGRTWNFSGQNDRAEALVAFHRAVERARK